MDPAQRDPATREWLRVADEDLQLMRVIATNNAPARGIAFHAQQAADKALKAALVFEGIDPPRTHSLNELRNLLPVSWRVRSEYPELGPLSLWATEGRYSFELPTQSADEALRQAEGIVASVLADLAARGLQR